MRIYLVKKDTTKPNAKDNWITMNSQEFSRFIATAEGQRRKKNFARLDGVDSHEPIIVAECEPAIAKQWESQRICALRRRKINANYKTISFEQINRSVDHLLTAVTKSVEHEVQATLDQAHLMRAYYSLSEDEQALVSLALRPQHQTTASYAECHHVCISAVHKRRRKALNKLKSQLALTGYEWTM